MHRWLHEASSPDPVFEHKDHLDCYQYDCLYYHDILKSPALPNFALTLSANDNAVPTVVIPANITLPPEDIVPPTPAAPTSRPLVQ